MSNAAHSKLVDTAPFSVTLIKWGKANQTFIHISFFCLITYLPSSVSHVAGATQLVPGIPPTESNVIVATYLANLHSHY